MRNVRGFWVFVCVIVLANSCLAHHMAVVVDKANNIQNVSAPYLAKIFRGEVKAWPDGREVALVLHSSSRDETTTLSRLVRMSDSQLKAFVKQHRQTIRLTGSDAEVVDAVASTPGAIGLVEERAINDRVNVIKVDGKLPLEAGYLPH